MVDVIYQQQVQFREQRQGIEEARRRLISQQSLRQSQDRNVALQRQQQLKQLGIQEGQIQQQETLLEQQAQPEFSSESIKAEQKQRALNILLRTGKPSQELLSLSKKERAEIEGIAEELQSSRERGAGIAAVAQAEKALSVSLTPELRRDIYLRGASGQYNIDLPNLNSKFEQFTTPQYTPINQKQFTPFVQPSKPYGPIQQFYTQAPLSVTNPKEYYRQQTARLLQKPEKSFKTLISYGGEKAQQYAEYGRSQGYPRIGPTGVLPYTPSPYTFERTPEQIGENVRKKLEVISFFVPVVGEARLTTLGLSSAGKIVQGDIGGIKEAGVLLGTSFLLRGAKGLKSAPEELVTSTEFISQRQSGRAVDVSSFAKELSDITNAPVAIRTQSRIQSGVVRLNASGGKAVKYTYKLSEESLGGGLTEFSGNRLIRGFIKDSEGRVVSNINAVSSESGKDLVSKILTTSITDTRGSLGKITRREVQTIAEKVTSVETKAPKGVAFVLKKPKGIDIVQTPQKTFIDIGEKKLNVKYFEDIGIAVAKPVVQIKGKALKKVPSQQIIKELELKFDEGVFQDIFKQRRVEKAIAKTTRQTIQEPLNILEGFKSGVLKKTSIEREFGSTKTSILAPKPKIERKGVSMNTFLRQYYKNIRKIERESGFKEGLVLATNIRLDQLKNIKIASEGTTALLVKGALPKTIKISPTQAEKMVSRVTSGAMFEGVNLFPEQVRTPSFEDFEVLARPRGANLDFVDLGLVQKPIVKTLQSQLQKQQLKLFQDTKTKQIPLTTNIPKILQKVIPLLRTNQLQRQEQQQRQLQRQKQLQRQSTSISPRPRIRPPRTRIPILNLGDGVSTAKGIGEDSFNVGIEVRRGGRFTLIGKESTLGKALMKASSFVDVNLARSFRLRSLSTGELLDVSELPIGFRRAKRESKTFVEQSSRALSQFGEKKEIKYFKKIKGRKRLL